MAGRVFISYSHKDGTVLSQLEIHLKGAGCDIECWSDRRIGTGQHIDRAIESALTNAQVAVLLVSKDFLASEYIGTKELRHFVEANDAGRITVIPVIVNHCSYERSQLSRIRAFNDPKVPLLELKNPRRQKEYKRLVEQIGDILDNLSQRHAGALPSSPVLYDESNARKLLNGFVEAEEPDILSSSRPTLALQRAYRLLVHLFRTATIDKFYAFDLAFHRWEELVNQGTQTLNFSREIFSAVEELMRDERCKDFRRILVVPQDSITSDIGQCVLRCIREWEQQLCTSMPRGTSIETRLFPAPRTHEGVRRLSDLCDFAMFVSEPSMYLSIVERTLNSPMTRPDDRVSRCKIETDRESGMKRQAAFEHYWSQSVPLSSVTTSGKQDAGGGNSDDK